MGQRKIWAILDGDELIAACRSNQNHLIMSVRIDWESREVWFVTVDGAIWILPFTFFNQTSEGTKPDFWQPAVIDHGHTVAFGTYEVAGDAMLAEAKQFAPPREVFKVNRQ